MSSESAALVVHGSSRGIFIRAIDLRPGHRLILPGGSEDEVLYVEVRQAFRASTPYAMEETTDPKSIYAYLEMIGKDNGCVRISTHSAPPARLRMWSEVVQVASLLTNKSEPATKKPDTNIQYPWYRPLSLVPLGRRAP